MDKGLQVSVVVPVYNAGDDMGTNIERLLDQSMPSSRFEVIFVDDGSNDGTGQMLDDLAARHEHLSVVHIPNSGWPGRPRNLGIEQASGEYVFFVDADDHLGVEALERMYAYARANDADIVLGKKAGIGRAVPRELFGVNRPRATLSNAPLADSLTVHGMFRRSFLLEHDLRFAEYPKRLEDHLFVAHAYLHARTVSVLADHVCYYHLRRGGREHLSARPFEPKDYFDSIREGIDLVEAHQPPAAARDRIYRRWLRVEMLTRLRGRGFLRADDERRQALIEQIADIAQKYLDTPEILGRLPPVDQIVARLALARSGRDLEAFADYETGMRARASVSHVELDGHDLSVSVEADLVAAENPVEFTYAPDGALRLALPLPDGSGAYACDIDTTRAVEKARVDLVFSAPGTGEFVITGRCTPMLHTLDEDNGPLHVVIDAEFTVDLHRAAAGRPLPAGLWRLHARVHLLGWKHDTDLRTTLNGRTTPIAIRISADQPPRLQPAGPPTGPRSRLRGLLRHLLRRIERRLRPRTPPASAP